VGRKIVTHAVEIFVSFVKRKVDLLATRSVHTEMHFFTNKPADDVAKITRHNATLSLAATNPAHE